MDVFGCSAGGPKPFHILYRPDVDLSAASIVAIADLTKQLKEQKRRIAESKAAEAASQRDLQELHAQTDAISAENRKAGPVASWLGEIKHKQEIERAERRVEELADVVELEEEHYAALRVAISDRRRRLVPTVWRPSGSPRVAAAAESFRGKTTPLLVGS